MTRSGGAKVGPKIGAKFQWKGAVAAIATACFLACGCGTQKYFRSASTSDDGGPGTGGAGINPGIGGAPGSGGVGGTVAMTGGTTGIGGNGASGGAGASIPGTGGVTCAGIGGTGVADVGGAGGSADTSRYGFETSVQSWRAGDGSPPFTSVNRSSAQRFAGQSSLAGAINAVAPGVYALGVDPATPQVPRGATITFHVYVPVGAAISWIQPFVQDTAFAFSGLFADVRCLTLGGWNTLSLAIPAGDVPISRMGVQFSVTPAWTGTVYLDSVNW
jgi:hypothetical protein